MYLFAPDGSRLALTDAFGLTQITFPNKVKSERTLTAGFGGLLSQDEKGTLLLAFDDDWDRTVLYDARLAPKKRYPRFEAKERLLHPDGAHLLCFERSALSVTTLDPKKKVASTELAKLSGLKLGKLALGPARPGEIMVPTASVSSTGTFACFMDGVVYGGQLAAANKPPALFWKLPLEAPTRQVVLRAGKRTVAIAALDRVLARAFVAIVDSRGEVREKSVPAIAMPVVEGDWLVFQKDERTVCRMSLSTEKVEELALDRPPPPAAGKAKAKPAKVAKPSAAPSHVGPGRVMPWGDKVYFEPWHGESILELVSGEEIDRKLPDAERPVREFIARKVLEIQQIAAHANVAVCLGALRFGKRQDFSFMFHYDAGDRSICQGIARHFQHTLNDSERFNDLAGYRWSGGGSRGGYDWYDEKPVDTQELERLFKILDRYSMDLVKLFEFFTDEYERAQREKREVRLTGEAERALLNAVLDTIAQDGPPKYADNLARWAKTPITAKDAIKRVAPLAKSKRPRPYRFHQALSLMLAHHLGAESAPVLEDLMFDQDYQEPNNNSENWTGVIAGIEALVAKHPELKPRFLARCEQAAKQEGTFAYFRDHLRDLMKGAE